jgi:signal peptidase II
VRSGEFPAGRLTGGMVAAAIVALDQAAKALVERALPIGDSIAVVPGVFSLTHVENTGIAFGLAGHLPLLVPAAIALTFLFLLFYNKPDWTRLPMIRPALALLAGGALGNLVDRIRLGAVIDYLDVRVWPVFNLADVAVTVGAGLLIASWVRRSERTPRGGDS